ncbi:hypothetical protein Dimus_032359, partial [Dionaea muscipula]
DKSPYILEKIVLGRAENPKKRKNERYSVKEKKGYIKVRKTDFRKLQSVVSKAPFPSQREFAVEDERFKAKKPPTGEASRGRACRRDGSVTPMRALRIPGFDEAALLPRGGKRKEDRQQHAAARRRRRMPHVTGSKPERIYLIPPLSRILSILARWRRKGAKVWLSLEAERCPDGSAKDGMRHVPRRSQGEDGGLAIRFARTLAMS